MSRPWPFRTGGRIAALLAIVVVVIVGIWLARRGSPRTAGLAATATEKVVRRDIALTVEATGTVEPINVVEVKSKASGQIVQMPVEIGSVVTAGDLLVQVDPRDVRNAFDQAQAALEAADARARVAASQRARAEGLFAQQVITATEHEAAMLDDANAKSALVAARTNLDLAKQRLEDATVRAPIAGTILEKPVSVGQVISSATASVSGGTILLRMAALDRIRMRALVVETDIGRVRPGQEVTVVVDAYPQRSFRGSVEKIEPQALVEQSVTMFPVLVSITNEDGLLLPGMNGEVTMLVDQRNQAIAVPLDALRSPREMGPIAASLGIDLDSLRANMRGRGRGGETFPGDAAASPGGDERPGGADGSGARDPRSRAGRDSSSLDGARGDGGAPRDSLRAGRRRWRDAAGSRPGSGSGPWPGPESRGRLGPGGGPPGEGPGPGGGFGRGGGFGTAGGPGSAARMRTQVAVVKTGTGFEPRLVRIGISDFDYAEVVGGLEEGEDVVMLSVIEIQEDRDQRVDRVRARVGGGVTGGGNRRGGN